MKSTGLPELIANPVCLALVFGIGLLTGCGHKNANRELEDIAANGEVLAFMETFEGRGALSDSSLPSDPEETVRSFRHPGDVEVELVLAEPEITQPVFIDFDHRGRLWVVQYNQYPYPEDLKVTSMDQHIRATFDRIPLPPGQGARGADKITFFEDRDGDGFFEHSTDAIDGLNIATSVAVGRGRIWVLNPPYLLAYPDADDDGRPDGPPVVHLEGFGLEDTHAVANSLRWGPDGWLYGAQGSTCTANVSSAVSRNVRFDGQAIWRYHPRTKIFEVFAEGGGNTFDVEIDAKGRLYSGDNGTSRGQYYKQGAYYVRNFGKHGALTNPYAFGYLSNMGLVGEKVRFTHAFVKYEGDALPDRYKGMMIALNPLQGYVQLSAFRPNGSTFVIEDKSRIIETDDRWFRPVDITTGPDGYVYVADWYDSRLSHVDPRDTWSKSNGRVYRIRNAGSANPAPKIDLHRLAGEELVGLLSRKDRWLRQQALKVIGDRGDEALIPTLTKLLEEGDPQTSLEALWALNLCGAYDRAGLTGLRHEDPFVRMWAVRLAAEQKIIPGQIREDLQRLAMGEKHPEVRSQLAATAKRLPGAVALAVLRNLLLQNDDSADPDIAMQIWWALESKIGSHSATVLQMFEDAGMWKLSTVRNHLLHRLMQRYVTQGDSAGFAAAAQLVKMAPSVDEVRILLNGLQEGMRGAEAELPSALRAALKPYERQLRSQTLAIELRQRDPHAVAKAIGIISDPSASLSDKLSYISIFGEIDEPRCIAVLLGVIESNSSSPALKQTSLQALPRYDQRDIGQRVVKAYPDKLRADPGVREAALALLVTRPGWSRDLMNAIARQKLPGESFIARTISRDDVPYHLVQQLRASGDSGITAMATRIWPEAVPASSAEKRQRMARIDAVLQSGKGQIALGEKIFQRSCGPCHSLFDRGGDIGPDLTGYDRENVNDLLANIVDPNAYVREEYATFSVKCRDGRVIAGSIVSREGNSLTVRTVSGERITLPESEIADIQSRPSLMPENLLDNFSDQDIRDLFAFLRRQ